jgi:hypothetical protein
MVLQGFQASTLADRSNVIQVFGIEISAFPKRVGLRGTNLVAPARNKGSKNIRQKINVSSAKSLARLLPFASAVYSVVVTD